MSNLFIIAAPSGEIKEIISKNKSIIVLKKKMEIIKEENKSKFITNLVFDDFFF